MDAYLDGAGWGQFVDIEYISNDDPGHQDETVAIKVEKAGTLKDLLTETDAGVVKELKIEGEIDYTDIEYIRICTALESLDLSGAQITDDGTGRANATPEKAFSGYASLTKVVLPQGLVRINDFTFTGGKLMDDSGFLPASLKEIGDYALSDWRSLTEIIIPENVEYIGTGAFRNQNALYKVEAMPVEPPVLGEDVWKNVDKSTVKLVVPENSEVAYRAADQWKDFFNAASAVNSVESDIKAIVNGNILTLTSGVVIREASLYDLNGILLSVDNRPAETDDFYLGGYGGNVYIVRCVLDNDKVELLKIVRD